MWTHDRPVPTSSRRPPAGEDPEAATPLQGFPGEVLRELRRYLSEPNCRAVMSACASAACVPLPSIDAVHLPFVVAQVERTFGVFGVRHELRERCISALRSLAPAHAFGRELTMPIESEDDIVSTRTTGKEICRDLGFSEVACVKVATAISELARNIFKYAGRGQVVLRRLEGKREGVEIAAIDRGPGIADAAAVLAPGYRSRSGMGVGLRGTRRLMDHFEIASQPGRGTTVIARKYKE